MALLSFKKLVSCSLLAIPMISTNVMAELSLGDLQGLDQTSISKIESIRAEGLAQSAKFRQIEQVALTLGAQYGYADRVKEMKKITKELESYLDNLFDFKQIMLAATDGKNEIYFLPPVITELNDIVSVSENNKVLRTTDKLFEITRKEKLVTSAPNWREYLLYHSDPITQHPNPQFLPKTPEEKEVWKEAISRGWSAGAFQADQVLNNRIEELGNDFVGMARYMRLVSEGKIKKAVIAKVHRNVVGGGDDMRINDTIYRLTSETSLVANAMEWKALVLDTREGLRYEEEIERLIKERN